MKKIISYCFFLPNKMSYSRRRWDKLWEDSERYWYNIPSLCVIDEIFYPDYIKRFYITQNVLDHELGVFFHEIQKLKNFEVEVIDKQYQDRELIIQRFRPFWEDWDIVLPRDIDSVVTIGEWQCSRVFEESPEAHAYSARAHRAHTKLMGGLCGFKPKLIQDKIEDNLGNFMERYDPNTTNKYDLDQQVLNMAFAGGDKEFSKNRYYDMPIHHAPRHPKGIPCKKIVPIGEIRSFKADDKRKNCQRIIESFTGGRWGGMPVDLRGNATQSILDLNEDVKDIVYSSRSLLAFYRIPLWASEDLWNSSSSLLTIKSLEKNISNLPASWFIPRIYRNPNSHKGDTSRELLDMWNEAGYCKLIDCKSSLSWWGSPNEEVLLYEFNNEKIARIPGNKDGSIKVGLFANLIPSDWGVPWIFWARRPRALEKRIEQGLLTYDQRDISSIFLGNTITPQQRSRRGNQDWSKSTEVFSLINSPKYKHTQEEYLNMMARSKFGLCLAGYGRKCNREPECMGLGIVPIVAPEVDMNYYDSPEEGVHYFRVKHPEEVKEIAEGLSESEWKQMSDNCIDWWQKNCSRRGSFETTQRIIEENYPS